MQLILLSSQEPDLQTSRCFHQLRADLGFHIDELAIRGGLSSLSDIIRIRRAAGNADIIHAWGYQALRIASFASDATLVYSPLPDDPLTAVRWLRAVMSRKRIRVISHSNADDRWLISHGVPANACAVVYPGVKMPRDLSPNPELRRKLGFGDHDRIVLSVGESLPHNDHITATQAITSLNFMDPRHKVMLMGKGTQVDAIMRFNTQWGSSNIVNAHQVDPSISFEDLVRAADIGLVTAPGRLAIWPILACMAGGLPLVAPATPEISEVLEDHHTALLYSPVTARSASQRTLMLLEDADLRRKLSDQARADAYELFSPSTHIGKMREQYELAASR